MPVSKNPAALSIHTHQFDPFLEISHVCKLLVHFNKVSGLVLEPIPLSFPIIITDYPAIVSDTIVPTSVIATESTEVPSLVVTGDDAVPVDLDLPEYTPRYEESSLLV